MVAAVDYSAPSPFESFNARTLEPEQVAKTFVPPLDHYDRLVRRVHTLIVGPRGSGKTTLLKMLQAPALEAWSHPDAERYRRRIDFTGVFVPADVSWSAQVYALGEGEFSPSERQLFSTAAFTTHVLRALVKAMDYRVHAPDKESLTPHRRASMTRSAETDFATHVSDAWGLKPIIPSLVALRLALGQRLLDIREVSSRERMRGSLGRRHRLADDPGLHLNFLDAAVVAVDAFTELAQDGWGRWALLFDELELAPAPIRTQLLESLRSVDERFLFKLSLSPYSEELETLANPRSAMPDHDYEEIALWYSRKEQGYPFCNALLESMLEEANFEKKDPEEVLGASEFDTAPEEWKHLGTAYRRGSRLQRRISSLASRDRSFRSYLDHNEIDPDNLGVLDGTDRASDVRKVTSLAAVRLAFRTPDPIGEPEAIRRRVRPRKTSDLYRGATSIFAMVEGNPRLFIGIMSRLLESYNGKNPVSPSRQSREISRAVARFRALLRTIPCPSTYGSTDLNPTGVLSVLDPVGDFLFDEVVLQDFNPDAPGSFTIDHKVDRAILDSLGKALNAGAIIYVPDRKGQALLTSSSLEGKRFRLAYLLSPYYKIPIRLGRAVNLSSILASRRKQPEGKPKIQPSLFVGVE